MKKLLLILVAAFAFIGCNGLQESEKTITARMGIVKRGDEVVFQTPCGYIEVENPLAVTAGGGILEGAAASSQPYITMKYANKSSYYNCWTTNGKDAYEQIIRNFNLSDNLVIAIVGCTVKATSTCHM